MKLIAESTAPNGKTARIFELSMDGKVYHLFEPDFMDTARSYVQACVCYQRDGQRRSRFLRLGPTFKRLLVVARKEQPDLSMGGGISPY